MNVTKGFCIGLLLSATLSLRAQEPAAVDRPKLVVGIVVDQMRWDYLYRYYERYGNDGFRRLLNEGFSCHNTQLNYVPTVTAVGHSCIYTGSVPAIHGIAANYFRIAKNGPEIYCTDDPSVKGVGSPSPEGRMSPVNLLTTTLPDELRLATNFRSKTIGIALKDRASILPAGHTANAAYWFDNTTGRWISSTYYMAKLPEWVEQFNRRDRAAQLLKQDWNTLYPIESYEQSTPDDTPYEQPFEAGERPVFPVRTSALLKKQGYGVIRNTPQGNTLTIEMAQAAIENEQLGADRTTDFLTVSFSSTDYIGHQFGVNAVETEDTYLRLDKELGDFFRFLDRQVGRGNYLLFLTADHAAAHNAGFMADRRLPAGEWQYDRTQQALDSLLYADYRASGLIRVSDSYQIYLNQSKIDSARLDARQIKETLLRYLNDSCPEVAYAVDLDKAAVASVPQVIRECMINGYNPQRSGSIQLIVKPGWYDQMPGAPGRGTSHGVWCRYDSHVPLIFMGWGIRPGKTLREVYTTDIAATVSALLHIQMPSGSIGRPITEIWESGTSEYRLPEKTK